MTNVHIHQGSILDCKVDVIVNPANSFLTHGGGLARIIDEAARGGHNGFVRRDWEGATVETLKTELNPARNAYQEWHLRQGLIPTGGAVLGPPGALCRRFKGIIHTVGPIWGGGQYLERALLNLAYSHALCVAEEAGFTSIAFPAISAGVFGVPIRIVAGVAASMTMDASLEVTHALMDDAHIEAYREALAR